MFCIVLKLFVTCMDSFGNVFVINSSLPFGNPRIFMPSVVSMLLVNCDRNNCGLYVHVSGMSGKTDGLLMNVRI